MRVHAHVLMVLSFPVYISKSCLSYLPAALSEAVMVGLELELSAVSAVHSCCSAWTASCLA